MPEITIQAEKWGIAGWPRTAAPSLCLNVPTVLTFVAVFFLLFFVVLAQRYVFDFTKFRLHLEFKKTGVSSWLNGVRGGAGWYGEEIEGL